MEIKIKVIRTLKIIGPCYKEINPLNPTIDLKGWKEIEEEMLGWRGNPMIAFFYSFGYIL